MDVSELRKRILRALEAGQGAAGPRGSADPAARRAERDAAHAAWDRLLDTVIVPVLRQAQGILKAEGHLFTVHAPAGSARLAADGSADTFIEFVLELKGDRPQVIGRTSTVRGRRGVVVEERPVAPAKAVADIGDDDVAAYLVHDLPRLVARV